MLYFAYGSNLWQQQMISRCPEHGKIGTGCLMGWRWIITARGYASIVVDKGGYVLGTVYELTESDVRNLDLFEGVEEGDYRKEMLLVDVNGVEWLCLVYIDQVVEEGKPKEEYICRINKGILDAGLPDEYVTRFLRPSVPVPPDVRCRTAEDYISLVTDVA
jgi:gamma-glutamylcyclotransferase (GGCT)/AIG2-like uncharacterized protein YtfP